MPFPPYSPRLSCLCLLAGVALAACEGEKSAAPAAPPPPQVTVVTLMQQPVTLTRELPGRTSPYVIAEVRPQATGIIKRRTFKEGGRVKAGQTLYELDASTYEADLASAKAALARAQATLGSARLNEKRTTGLAKIDAVSRQDYENAVAALRQAEADEAAARAAVTRAGVQLGYTRITSPISGRIGKSTVTQGALVTANQAQALATVQQFDPIYVDVTRSSRELLDLRQQIAAGTLKETDSPVTIVLEDGTPYSRPGKLTFADVTVDPDTGSYLLRIVVPNPETVLLPGMYVRAIVGTAERQQAVLAPQKGIQRDPKGSTTAMVLGPDGKVQARVVKVSRAIGDQWLVEDGLAAGDRVIVEGLQKVKPGMVAETAEAKPLSKGADGR
jgi:membrane fusion protein (multidrug efflux system)